MNNANTNSCVHASVQVRVFSNLLNVYLGVKLLLLWLIFYFRLQDFLSGKKNPQHFHYLILAQLPSLVQTGD